MRSGLPPACFNFVTNEIGECLNANDSSSGGNIVYADDQLTKCIDRDLATEGITHPWSENGLTVYSRGAFQYSNCDTGAWRNNLQGYRTRYSNLCGI